MRRPRCPDRLLDLAAPMAVWALHLVVVYSLVGLGCEHGWHLRRVVGLPLLTGSLLLATAAALGLVAWLGWRAWRCWRILPRTGDPADPVQRRQRFIGIATAALALLAFVAVTFTATPIFMLPPCL